ncbi:MAG: type II CAAX endopeptidase family protein [Bacillota bacterium]|nr:type II CAAX endopeptidase family protein [Bacillota bacterium]
MKNTFKFNLIVYFIFNLTLVVLSSLAAFMIVFSNHGDTGIIPPQFDVKEIYYSESWYFQLEEYGLYLPEKSIVLSVYLNNNFSGIILKTDQGTVTSASHGLNHRFTDGFLAICNDTFMNIKGDTLFSPLENGHTKNRLTASFRELIKLPEIQTIGYSRIFLPPPGSHYIYLEDSGSPLVSFYSEPRNNNRFLLYFALIILINILVIHILTLDLQPPRGLKELLASHPEYKEILLGAGSLLIIYIGENLVGLKAFPGLIQPLLLLFYYGVFLLLFILARRKFITQNFTLHLIHLDRSIITVIVLTFIITAFSALKFPSGFTPNITSQKLLISFILYFFFALGKEIFWRSFLQNLFERLWGRWAGILLVTLIFSSFFFMPVLLDQSTSPDIYSYMEAFFFIPAASFLLSYIYYRTRNIFSSALLHTLILFLPQVLLF